MSEWVGDLSNKARGGLGELIEPIISRVVTLISVWFEAVALGFPRKKRLGMAFARTLGPKRTLGNIRKPDWAPREIVAIQALSKWSFQTFAALGVHALGLEWPPGS